MSLQQGSVYRTPDGRLFKAEMEIRRYGDHDAAWTLVPLDIDMAEGRSWRDRLGNLLFLEHGRIVYFDLQIVNVEVRDTGWKISDLKLEKSTQNEIRADPSVRTPPEHPHQLRLEAIRCGEVVD